ncbi:MAG: SOS response-associated peptidase [Gemmataceae bacterium]|nr:SOS response-associated peptidase [Gemmataceae bacterium]
MCGRFALFSEPEELAAYYQAELGEKISLRYNIAPTQSAVALRHREGGKRALSLLHWGLVPSWAKDAAMASRLINARVETAAEKPSFRAAWKKRRCIIPASGFYEWKKTPENKQPYFISLAGGRPLSFAGLWESRAGDDGAFFESCSILTTSANADMANYHERMPVFLEPWQFDRWLDLGMQDPVKVMELIQPFPPGRLKFLPVSTHVNKPANDDAECVRPLNGGI